MQGTSGKLIQVPISLPSPYISYLELYGPGLLVSATLCLKPRCRASNMSHAILSVYTSDSLLKTTMTTTQTTSDSIRLVLRDYIENFHVLQFLFYDNCSPSWCSCICYLIGGLHWFVFLALSWLVFGFILTGCLTSLNLPVSDVLPRCCYFFASGPISVTSVSYPLLLTVISLM